MYREIRLKIAVCVQLLRIVFYRSMGYKIDWSCEIERGVNLDRLNPAGIIIGEKTIVSSRVTILSHKIVIHFSDDRTSGEMCTTIIGKRCIIGIGAIIMPGIAIGDRVIVGSGAVVTKDVPSNSIVAGNPAKVIKSVVDFEGLKV